MVENKNKKLISYIDKITSVDEKDNKNYIEQLRKLPSNGIRGLINYKIMEMQENHIMVNLYISKRISYKKFDEITDNLNFDICKLLGIYLDNAIQAVENLNEKNIDINIYEENEVICICISNNYEGIIEASKLDVEGYSTKGKEHGYGLSIAKKVIDNNINIDNEILIREKVFTQKLKIKM